jgi:hypothetical protein
MTQTAAQLAAALLIGLLLAGTLGGCNPTVTDPLGSDGTGGTPVVAGVLKVQALADCLVLQLRIGWLYGVISLSGRVGLAGSGHGHGCRDGRALGRALRTTH